MTKFNLKKERRKVIETISKKAFRNYILPSRKSLIEDVLKIIEKQDEEFMRELHIYLCSKLEGEILLKKADIREVYSEIDKIAGIENGKRN